MPQDALQPANNFEIGVDNYWMEQTNGRNTLHQWNQVAEKFF